MGRGRKRNRRRQRFVILDAFGDGDQDMQRLIEEARKLGVGQQKRREQNENAEAVASKALAKAEAVTELYLLGIPRTISASDLVHTLLKTLYIRGRVPLHVVNAHGNAPGSAAEACILRCEIRENRFGAKSSAFVTVRNDKLAQILIGCSPLQVHHQMVKVLRSTRTSVPGIGSAWRTTRDPGSMRWKIGTIQVGERTSEHSFSSFWSSSPFFDLSQNSHVELNPVAHVLAVTVGRQQVVLKGVMAQAAEPKPKDFTTTNGMLRMEFPFRTFCDNPRAENTDRTKGSYAVSFSISKAPHLFRSHDEQIMAFGMKTWDCLGGTAKETRWIRTVDPTRNLAFSRVRSVRIMLDSKDMYSLYKQLHHLCLADCPRPTLVSTKSVTEKNSPDRHAMFHTVAKDFGISFPLRYAVDCILSLGTVRVADIDVRFWRILSTEMTEDEASSVLDFMLYRLSSNESYRVINDPLKLLRNVMKMFNIYTHNKQGNLEAVDIGGESDSVGTESTEDFTMERYFEELRLDELTIHDDSDVSVSSLEREVIPQQASAKRPSKQHESIRRIIYTPTRTLAQKAEPDLLNRVLREFSKYKDRFLRVSFSDEDGRSVAHTGSEDVFARVRSALRNGIYVAGEKFVFLSFSNSQLRDHAVWMYNETPDATSSPPTADDIRAWMGNFSKIRVPGKYVHANIVMMLSIP